ncbi:MAG: coproporphyrinogen III oxidase family protein [Anaerolineae bacterium]|nr:coproporphyrinogen III oxidase family protein [Anaerolineae bacterium]
MIIDQIFSSSFRVAAQALLNLKPTRLPHLPPPTPGSRYTLYSHVPFCESLCPYCSFNRFILNEKSAISYFGSLRDEMRMVARQGYQFETLYIGGGTPTVMLDELVETIDLARDLFDLKEVSCETNPNHLDDKLVAALSKRVQRLSVGVQSFDDELLKRVNRYERFGSGAETLARIQQVAGAFDSLNVDMIFNFPGQDADAIKRDIDMVIQSGANQTTFYPLMSSPSVNKKLNASVGEVTYNQEAEFYEMIVKELSRAYELSTAWTFSRKGGGLIDEYIVDSMEYVGIGSGSFSYLDGALYVNTFSLDTYRKMVGSGKNPVTGKRRFNKTDQMRYRFMMELFGLRLDRMAWLKTFGLSVETCLPLEITFFNANGAFAEYNEQYITLSPRGRYLLVVMMREFFSGINRIRDQARQAVLEADRAKKDQLHPSFETKA